MTILTKKLTKKEIVESIADKLKKEHIKYTFTKDYAKVTFDTDIHFEMYPPTGHQLSQLSLYIHIESTKPEIAHDKFFNLIAKNPQLLNKNIYVTKDEKPTHYELITSIKELNQRKWYGIELFNINIDDKTYETSIDQVIEKLREYMEKIKY